MIAEAIAFSTGALAGAAEWAHARRCQRVARLAFGPAAAPRVWTKIAPALRVISLMLVTWGALQLYLLAPRASRPQLVPEGGFRHLVIALDVSPSMQLKDGGPQRQQTRARRASEVLLSMLERVALDQMRVSVVAFYTGAKPAVVDTFDIEVVKNILNDLPLEYAFNPGKTSLIDGIRESAALAKGWPPGSTTLFIVSDGDTIPDKGLPELPRSIGDVLVLGVGNTLSGVNIDGHLSRQDAPTLRQLANRLRANYLDVNEKHLPSQQLASLSKAMPMRDAKDKGRRELALAAVATGATLLCLIPLALAFLGSSWLPRVPTRPTTSGEREGSYAITSGSSHTERLHSTSSRAEPDFAGR
jgi:Ca-activated chloride channel homolog